MITNPEDTAPAVSTDATDLISREAAVAVPSEWENSADCNGHTDNPCCHVRTASAIAERLRALPVLQSTPTTDAIEVAAKEIAAACNGSDNDECMRVQVLWDMIENPSIANEESFAKWIIEVISKHLRPAAIEAELNHELRSACCDAPTRTANTDYNVCTSCKEACDTTVAAIGATDAK